MAHRGWKRDGFTPAKKAKALEALGKYGNVADACRVAGISDTTFYRHLNKDPDFAQSVRADPGEGGAGRSRLSPGSGRRKALRRRSSGTARSCRSR